jgi:hypothetical protein
MPCRNDLNVVVHSFPANFEVDTHYFSQALAEHNVDRVNAGLPEAEYLSLSEAEHHDVLWRAQKIKSAARSSSIQAEPPSPVAVAMKDSSQLKQGMHFVLSAYLLAFGIVGMIALLLKILG